VVYPRQLIRSLHCAAAAPLDSLPQNGAVVTRRAVCGSTHRENYVDIALIAIAGPMIALAAVIALGSTLGSF
jgi:H+/gluconate symporter-like permease